MDGDGGYVRSHVSGGSEAGKYQAEMNKIVQMTKNRVAGRRLHLFRLDLYTIDIMGG